MRHHDPIPEAAIIHGLCSLHAGITKEYFYGYCRRAYLIFDRKYQLHTKEGLDFYSLAHEYYIQLLTHHFQPLLAKPREQKLSTWMARGFHFVVLDALKAYNKEYAHLTDEASDVVLEYLYSTEPEEQMMFHVAEAVASHYHDRMMQEIAHMIFFAGFKQKEVAAQLGITPAAVNLRYKRMMEEVVTPFVIENYGRGLYSERTVRAELDEAPCAAPCATFLLDNASFSTIDNSTISAMDNRRITPSYITSLKANEIFVFGSNLQGIHAGGAARMARLHFGAVMGQGVGLQGQSYAIPTMQGGPETIRPYVDEFIAYARRHPQLRFYVTAIGCGIAGFEPREIAPLFTSAQHVANIYLPAEFWEVIE